MAYKNICSIDGCGKLVHGQGYCCTHYQRWRKGKDVNTKVKVWRGVPLQWLKDHVNYRGEDCLIWPFNRNIVGYAIIAIVVKRREEWTTMNAHRMMCVLAHGEPPDPKLQAAHSCGKGRLGCVHPQHLSWKTAKANVADKIEHGTIGQKLTPEIVLEIRSFQGKLSSRKVAPMFGIAPTNVCKIWNRTLWGWVE